MTEIKLGVVIATAMGRVDYLFSRALMSVLRQTIEPDMIVVIDDNDNPIISKEISQRIKDFEKGNLFFIPNTHSKHMSGCGAWNTGLEFLKEKLGDAAFVAILDDDDEWEADHLEHCINHISSDTLAVFAYLRRGDCANASCFTISDLTIDNFLVGNPGIQGSNMFFLISSLDKIGYFDEALSSCTDRDLMIRFLEEFGVGNIRIVPEVTVQHYVHKETVTSNIQLKTAGLNVFYEKHLYRFANLPLLKASLVRAEKLFNYPNSLYWINRYKQNNPILITGVCGFIGSHVACTLLADDWIVLGIDNLSTGTERNIDRFKEHPNFSFYQCDIEDSVSIDKIFIRHAIKTVFHFAALPRILFSIDFPDKSYTANVIATKLFAATIKRHGVSQFVFASSSSVYGQGDGSAMTESDVPRPISPYAEQKYEAERELQRCFFNTNTKLLICRLFNVYGYTHQQTNQYSTLIIKWLHKIKNKENITIYGDGSQSRDFTYINDVCSAFISILNTYQFKASVEILNIGNGLPIKVNDILNLLQTHYHKCSVIEYKQASIIEPSYTYANNTKARELLDWAPQTTIQIGIDMTIMDLVKNEQLVVGVTVHNSKQTIRRCLESIVCQKNLKRKLAIVIADDNSVDNWQDEVKDMLTLDNLAVISLNFNDVVKTRNALNTYILNNYPDAVFIGRLDADDEYTDEYVLQTIETAIEKDHPDIILAGNYLRQNGIIIDRKNYATEDLKDIKYLLQRLKAMANGDASAELPSCNIWIRPSVLLPYPYVKSAEDHFLLVYYLLHSEQYKISILKDTLICIYDLGGEVTEMNKQKGYYLENRQLLYNKTYYANKVK